MCVSNSNSFATLGESTEREAAIWRWFGPGMGR
jgi:hypothetical protein